MDKEGQNVQFSSDAIPEKQKPDFFIASNDRPSVEKKLGLDKAKMSQRAFFKSLRAKLANYFKHPFRGKHKIATISAIILVVVIIAILVTLGLTVWRAPGAKDPSPLSEEELATWNQEQLPELVHEASLLSDDELNTFYSDHINNERSEYKSIDLTIEYSRELSNRGFVDRALSLLDAMEIDDMACLQIAKYYEAYQFLYFMVSNMTENPQTDYYSKLSLDQWAICLSEATGLDITADSASDNDSENDTSDSEATSGDNADSQGTGDADVVQE